MVFAVWLVHSGLFATVTQTGGWALELPMLFLLGAVAIALLGPGRFAVAWNPMRDLVASEPGTAGDRRRRDLSPTPITHRM